MSLQLTKMHGLGNDFVMLRADQLPDLSHERLTGIAKALCHRQFGVGADGLIVAAPAEKPDTDGRFIYYNNDGSIAEMCGNGIRCYTRFACEEGLLPADKTRYLIETLAGILEPELANNDTIRVNMGAPTLNWRAIPFNCDGHCEGDGPGSARLVLEAGLPVVVWPVSMGNPHAILFEAQNPEKLDPAFYGPLLEKHSAFPAKTNVEFVKQLDPATFEVVVWERGCGFTMACGTGACATAVAAKLAGYWMSETCTIKLPGGDLAIEWEGSPTSPVYMTGPAAISFKASIEDELVSPWLEPELASVVVTAAEPVSSSA